MRTLDFIIVRIPTTTVPRRLRVPDPPRGDTVSAPCPVCFGTGWSLSDPVPCPDCGGRAVKLVPRDYDLAFGI